MGAVRGAIGDPQLISVAGPAVAVIMDKEKLRSRDGAAIANAKVCKFYKIRTVEAISGIGVVVAEDDLLAAIGSY